MEGNNYQYIDKMLMEDEFSELAHRVVITAEPEYLALFTFSPQVVSYQRWFLNATSAASGMK